MIITASLSMLLLNGDILKAKAPSLEDLQQAYAMNHFEPESHMALAKFHHDGGNRLLAYYILESARRNRFEEKVFDAAYARAFYNIKPFDNSKEAEDKLLARHQQEPKDADTLFGLSDIYVSRGDWKNAKSFLNQLIVVKPEEYKNYEALAEVYRREKDDTSANEIVEGFFRKHPDSVESFAGKIGPLMRKEPDKARSLLEEALKKHPKHAMFLFNQAVLLQDANKLNEAEETFVKAAESGKNDAHIQGWVGRFFLRVRQNEEKSLHYYLNAYFLDPHFYDTEYAEARILKLNASVAAHIVEKAEKDGKKIEDLLKNENPAVTSYALVKLAAPWDVKKCPYFLEAMGHDDPTIRMQAMGILMKNADDSLGTEIQAMMGGNDLRKRGLACYLAVHVWKTKGVESVRAMLAEKAQLVRFDAISALWFGGGEEGKRIVRDHLKNEKHPWLINMMKALDKKLE